jgi:CheY-like chemotaxis protein
MFVGCTTDSPVLKRMPKLKYSSWAVPRTVLIADDSASMRRGVRFLLNRRRGELVVSEAVDGVDAIEKAKETKPDLILLDLAMPRMNGAEAASVLKSTLPETPIILFTMYTDLHADSLSAFFEVDFISKVDGIPKLLERVDALLPPTPNGEDTLW